MDLILTRLPSSDINRKNFARALSLRLELRIVGIVLCTSLMIILVHDGAAWREELSPVLLKQRLSCARLGHELR